MDILRILDQTRFFEGISAASKEALSKYCMPYESGAWIYVARGLKYDMEEAWPTTKDWN